MAYQVDHSPVEYLQRRIKYYRKKLGQARNWHKSDFLLSMNGKRKVVAAQAWRIAKIENYIKEYEAAIMAIQDAGY